MGVLGSTGTCGCPLDNTGGGVPSDNLGGGVPSDNSGGGVPFSVSTSDSSAFSLEDTGGL